VAKGVAISSEIKMTEEAFAMRKVTKLAISFGSAALILGGGAFAQGPTLGSTTLDPNTGVPSGCPAGFTCLAPIANEAGFLQREVTNGTERYIQTIIQDGSVAAGAVGQGFASEDFVRFNNTGQQSAQGIRSQLTVRDAAAADSFFISTSNIEAGWAVNGGDAQAVIDMQIQDGGQAGQNLGFDTQFSVDTSFNAATGLNTLNSLRADQTVGLGLTGAVNNNDRQRFYTEIKQAAAAGSSDLATVGTGTVRGNGATWAAGEVIQVVWAGQQVAGTPQFGTQTVNNVTQNNLGVPNFTSLTDLASPGPWLWNAEFGTTPVF